MDSESELIYSSDHFITCKVTNLQLFNAFYDADTRSLYNLSDIEAYGLEEELQIYFVALTSDAKERKVPSGYVAVKVCCGGLVRP